MLGVVYGGVCGAEHPRRGVFADDRGGRLYTEYIGSVLSVYFICYAVGQLLAGVIVAPPFERMKRRMNNG